MVRSVFISRDLEQVKELAVFCVEQEIHLTPRSLIRFEGIYTHPKRPFDLIFFPSIRAAAYFLEYNTIPNGVAVGCIGEQTAVKLRDIGVTPSFIGKNSGDPKSVARAFAAFAVGKRVLIPSSTVSNKTLQEFLPEDQVETLTVYRTIPDPVRITDHELYVFSSPSNLNAFLELNTIPDDAQVIAWGKTTLNSLESKGLKHTHCLNDANTNELIKWIKQNG